MATVEVITMQALPITTPSMVSAAFILLARSASSATTSVSVVRAASARDPSGRRPEIPCARPSLPAAAPRSLLPGEEPQQPAGEVVRKPEGFLHARIEMHCLFVRPDQGGPHRAVARPCAVVRGLSTSRRVAFHRVVVERQALPRSPLWAGEGVGEPVIRAFVCVEDQRVIQ